MAPILQRVVFTFEVIEPKFLCKIGLVKVYV